jgi:AraC family transcriptional regulator
MSAAFATVTEDEGVLATSADVKGFTVADLRFPSGYVQGRFEPELSYLAVVLEGSLEKSFARRTMQLHRACALTMPAGAAHAAGFGPLGARIVVVKPRAASNPGASCLNRLVEHRGRGLSWLAWRLAGEPHATNAAAPLAAEGLALELLAAAARDDGSFLTSGRPPAWLRSAEELLRARIDDCVSLSQLANAVRVHPTHLARVFRAHHGVSVGEYGRRVRVEWAAAELARGDTALALIATRAGFADQSHFTRVFRHHIGTTPAAYRAHTRAAAVPS